MKKVYLILIVTLLFLGCQNERETNLKSEKNQKYKVAINFEYYPFVYKNETTGEPEGFIYEISEEIEKRGNFIVQLDEKPISKIIDEIAVGNYDAGIMAFAITEERHKMIDFSETIYNSQIIILGNKNIDYKKNSKEIYGVQSNSIFEEKIEKLDKDSLIVKDRECRLTEALLHKEIDYIVTYLETANNLIKNNPELFIKESLGKIEVAFAISKNLSKNESEKINSIISEMRADGTIKKLKTKYNLPS